MEKLYRKILLIISMIVLPLSANASSITMDYLGPTVVNQQSVERSLLITNDDDGEYNIAIKPLNIAINSVDGKVSIPLQDLYINNNSEDVYVRYNEYSVIFNRINLPNVPKNLTAKIRDFGMVPAGIYNIPFEIQATDANTGEISGTTIFNLQFDVPRKQEIDIHGESPVISVGASAIAGKVSRITNNTSPMIYINSNTDWILTLKTDDFDSSKGEIYVRTIGASSNVKERLQERVLLQPNKEIIIAKGIAPSNNEYVTVEYSVDNNLKKLMRAGMLVNRLRYVLKENRG